MTGTKVTPEGNLRYGRNTTGPEGLHFTRSVAASPCHRSEDVNMNTTINLSVSLIFGLIIILVVGGAIVALLLRWAQSMPLRKPREAPPGHDHKSSP